ncbi:hypothetical protein [Reyranella sp.]|uniref:hypothetical protein n=1 Tax=Reyranella sp. TaxID=1929291 RepID=UPI0035255835
MVYGFIKQSNGHLKVDSKPGKGTIFRLYLPRSATPTRIRLNLTLSSQSAAGAGPRMSAKLWRVLCRATSQFRRAAHSMSTAACTFRASHSHLPSEMAADACLLDGRSGAYCWPRAKTEGTVPWTVF